jgi:hypothetical protein
MLKLIMCVARLPHLSRAEFDLHWRERHAPLVVRHSRLLGIRRYIQTVPLADALAQERLRQGRGTLPVDFDGCAELWWDDLPSHLAARASEEGLRALHELIEDEKRFVDLSRSLLWYGQERGIV